MSTESYRKQGSLGATWPHPSLVLWMTFVQGPQSSPQSLGQECPQGWCTLGQGSGQCTPRWSGSSGWHSLQGGCDALKGAVAMQSHECRPTARHSLQEAYMALEGQWQCRGMRAGQQQSRAQSSTCKVGSDWLTWGAPADVPAGHLCSAGPATATIASHFMEVFHG